MVSVNLRRFSAMFSVLVLALLGASIVLRAQTVTFASAQTTVPASGLNGPSSMAADGAGDVFIADTGNNRVVKVPAGGGAQTTVGSGLSGPHGVAVDAAGDVFIADTGNKRVVKLPAGGGAQSTIATGLLDPLGVAVDSKGDVFIADFSNGLVEIPFGGSQTLLSGYLQIYITSIAADTKGNLFLTDTATFDVANGTFDLPPQVMEIPNGCPVYVCVTTVFPVVATGVAVDGAGDIFFADSTALEIPSGGALTVVGAGIANAVGVAVDPKGDVFIADAGNSDVVEVQHVSVGFLPTLAGATQTLTLTYNITASGTLSTQNVMTQGAPNLDFKLASGSTCTGAVTKGSTCVVKVAFTPTASGPRGGAVQLTNASGTVATTLLYGTGTGPQVAFDSVPQTTLSSTLGGADGVAVNGKGDVIIADTFNNRVVDLPASGGALTTIGAGLCEPAGVAVDGFGDVLIADYCNNRVVEVPPNGAAQFTVGTGLGGPKDVAVDGAGDVFIADTGNNRVVEVPAGGAAQFTVGTGLSSPTGVAVDAAGDVFIADTNHNHVVEVTPAGVQSTVGANLSGPTGVAVDAAGDVFIADYVNQRVVEVPAVGSQFTIGSGYVGPHGVAVDGAGNLFVADRDDARAFEFKQSAPPPTINFATSVPVNQVDATDGPQTVTIQNIGNQQLTFATPPTGNNPSYPANFPSAAPTDGCAPNLPLKPGSDCTVSANFDPTAVGANSGSVVITDNSLNGANVTQSIAFSGTGLFDTQTITFNPSVTSYPYTAGSFPVSATASSNLPVTYATLTPAVCGFTNGGTVSILATGICTIQVTQTGNAIYSAAAPVSVNFTIMPGPQTITFNPGLTTYSFAAKSFLLSGSATSNLPVAFSATTPLICKVTGTTANIVAGGTCTIQATQPGNADYSAATPVSVSFIITPVGQTITFPAITAMEHAASTLKLVASASSKLPVSFASLTETICTVSGSTAKLLIEGTCKIRASQTGNSTYTAATNVSQSFTVHLASQAISFAPIVTKEYALAKLKLKATASSGLGVRFASLTPTVCTVLNGEASLLIEGTCTIAASQPGSTVYAAATKVSRSFTVLPLSQTITFATIASQKVGTSLKLSATASSKLAVTFSSTTTKVCSVSGATAKMLTTGTCMIDASQPGNHVYAAAPKVARAFTVTK